MSWIFDLNMSQNELLGSSSPKVPAAFLVSVNSILPLFQIPRPKSLHLLLGIQPLPTTPTAVPLAPATAIFHWDGSHCLLPGASVIAQLEYIFDTVTTATS